jgi:pimeloyl-ACP methyl ester carboxylesterase
VVCFEFPGCGFSYPRFGFDFSLDAYVGIVRDVMEALAIPRATLAFTCVNALVAMAFARRYPERIECLALAQVASLEQMRAFADRIDFRFAGIPVLHTPVLGQVFMMAKRNFAAHAWFRIALPKGFDVESIWRVTRAVYDEGGQFCLASIIQGQETATPQAVTMPDCSASVAWGMADRTHAKTDKGSIHAHLPQAAIRHLPDCGHCPDLEAPELYSGLLVDT